MSYYLESAVSLGRWLAVELERRRHSLQEAADNIGLSASAVGKICRGERGADIERETEAKIASAYGPLPIEVQVYTNAQRMASDVLRSKSETYVFNDPDLTTIPSELFRCTHLTTLNLSGCRIRELPPAICELRNLRHLNLSYNLLHTVPDVIGDVSSLESLDVSRNQLSRLPAGIGRLHALKELFAWENHLTSLPKELGLLSLLRLLDISGNALSVIEPVLGDLRSLEVLNVGSNQLTALPECIGHLTQLQSLFAFRNKLGVLPPSVGSLTELRELDVSHNQLVSLPAEIGRLQKLHNLILNNNRLELLPEAIAKLCLNRLVIAENPVAGTVPPELQASTPQQLLRYYFHMRHTQVALRKERRARSLNEAKILVVGEPGVGKTMLVEWLTQGTSRQNSEWTRGIQIVPWQVNHEDASNDPIKVAIWDFGGQEIMQATHQFFLTERSLYLLVLDSRVNEEQSQVRYWLEKIRAFGGDSPVIVVLNKKDQGLPQYDESRLRQDYPRNLRSSEPGNVFFRTACVDEVPERGKKAAIKAGDGIAELREAVAARVRSLDNVTQPVPPEYLDAKAAFEKESRKHKRMDRAEFDRICKKCKLKDEIDRDTLLSYLKSLGSLFHYKRGQQDNNTLVLDPEWLTGGVYKILTDPELRERGGMLRTIDLARIFRRSMHYPDDAQRFLLDMMEGDPFELSFKIPDNPSGDDNWLIPELLPTSEPDHGIRPDASLNVQYHYKFLPAGLLPRFIVRMHNALKPGDAWRNGVVLTVDGRRVLVRGVRAEKKVYVSAQGREPGGDARRALVIVRQNLDMVHKAMRHLEVTERIVLPDRPDVSVGYDFVLELEREQGSHYEFKPEGAKRYYSVRELLDGIEERRPPQRSEMTERQAPLMTELGEVFISYAHEDAAHSAAVLKLANDLRAWGIDAWIDQYVELSHQGSGGPPKGWTHWMEERIEKAKVVLVVPGPKYLARVKKEDLSPKGGHGAVWEGQLIYQELYDAKGVTNKFTPVLMNEEHKQYIPKPLRDFNYYKAYEADGFDRLYRAITGQPRIVAPPLGTPRVMPNG